MTNPMQLMNILSNPLYARAQQMANGKSSEQLEQIAKNICKEKGVDYEQAMHQFQSFSQMFNNKK